MNQQDNQLTGTRTGAGTVAVPQPMNTDDGEFGFEDCHTGTDSNKDDPPSPNNDYGHGFLSLLQS